MAVKHLVAATAKTVMTNTRASASLVVTTALVGSALALTVATPVAHADVLADIRGTVSGDRAKYGPACPSLRYNQTLQDIGFARGQPIPLPDDKVNAMIASYGGQLRPFIGVGDPMAAARTDAYKKGAGPALSDCLWTEYGVSFVRDEATETSWVGIVFGKPKAVTTPPSGPGAPAPEGTQPGAGTQPGTNPGPGTPPPSVKCPTGGPQTEVPADQTCPPPTNAVRVTFDRGIGFGLWTVNVKNNAGIGGSCTYRATNANGLPGASEDFDIGPNGSASFSVPAPIATYNVVTKCAGTYDGKQVEFGNDAQTVAP